MSPNPDEGLPVGNREYQKRELNRRFKENQEKNQARTDKAKLEELVKHANSLIESLQRYETAEADDNRDDLASKCFNEALAGLASLIEQPILANQKRLEDTLKRAGYTTAGGITFESLVQQMRDDPALFELFLSVETQLLSNAGATEATLTWARTILIATVNDPKAKAGSLTGPAIVKAAQRALEIMKAEKPSSGGWGQIRNKVLGVVQIVIGGVTMLADIPIVVSPAGGIAVVSVALGGIAIDRGLDRVEK